MHKFPVGLHLGLEFPFKSSSIVFKLVYFVANLLSFMFYLWLVRLLELILSLIVTDKSLLAVLVGPIGVRRYQMRVNLLNVFSLFLQYLQSPVVRLVKLQILYPILYGVWVQPL